jgi:hypothetical protein
LAIGAKGAQRHSIAGAKQNQKTKTPGQSHLAFLIKSHGLCVILGEGGVLAWHGGFYLLLGVVGRGQHHRAPASTRWL